jgi:hypothetical protein
VVYVDYHLDDPHVRSVPLVVHPPLSASIHQIHLLENNAYYNGHGVAG